MRTRLARTMLAIGLVAACMAWTASPALAQDPDADSIAEIAVAEGSFQSLITALTAAGLDVTLADCDSDDVYTVFAPNDAGFAAAIAAFEIDTAALLTNVELVTSFLQYHLLEGAVEAAAAIALDGTDVTTLNGEDLGIKVDGETLTLISGNPYPANVVAADIQACNGVIHVIDTPLIAPTIAAALDLPTADELADTGATSDALIVGALAVLAGGLLLAATGRRLRAARQIG